MCRESSSEGHGTSSAEVRLLYAELHALRQQVAALTTEVAGYMKEADLDREVRIASALKRAEVVIQIVGGLPEDRFPECASLGRRVSFTEVIHRCSGVLVHPRLILTAAHCHTSLSPLDTCVYNSLTRPPLALSPGAEQRTGTLKPHASFAGKAFDIGAFVLDTPATVTPAVLATSAEIAAATSVIVCGFGSTSSVGFAGSGIKRSAPVPILALRRSPNEDLADAETFHGFDSRYEFVADDATHGLGESDSGGPAYIMVGGQPKLVGLGVATSKLSGASVITRLDAFQTWIGKMIPA